MARSRAAQPYFTLDDYQVWWNIPECAFNGVEDPNEDFSACDHIWKQWERDMLARALKRAEDTLANNTKFFYGARFLTDEGLQWTDPLQLKYHWVVGGGIEGLTTVTPSASDFTTDPATITVAQSDFSGGTSEIWITETSTGYQIVPDMVTESGANYIISIDQCRLIEWDDLQTQTDPIDYDNTFPAATWLKLADLTIQRRYLDDTSQATITFGPSCKCGLCGTAGEGSEHTGVVYVIDPQISKVRVQMADYNATTDTWTCSYPELFGCYDGSKVEVNYRAGTTTVPGYEDAIISLAHTYIAIEPCGCSLFKEVVKRDQRIPPTLTAERINNPFGETDGAWSAWQWTKNSRHGVAILLGKTRNSRWW